MKPKHLLLVFLSIILILQFSNASVWERQTVDSTGTDKGWYCSLVIDSKNDPHIAYYDADFQDLRYAHYQNGVWTVEIVDSIEHAGEYCSLALDSQDRPHISYQQDYLNQYLSLKYATLTDTGWAKIIVDTPKDTTYYECGENSSIAVNGNDYPCISYTQYYPTKIKFAYEDENGWHIADVTDVYDSWFTKLVFDNTDRPVIGFHYYEEEDTVYHNRLKIGYLNPTDSSWSFVTVPDSIGSIDYGDLLGFDMDSQNNAYFTYQNYWYDYLRLAVYDGQNWSIETVTEDPGLYSSPGLRLKVDHQDQPAIVEFYYSDEVRLYQKVNGQWHYQIVDAEEYGINPTVYCSLDFDSNNYPRIAIQGRTTTYSRSGLFYYKYWPGDPLLSLPEPSHDFGTVWTQSYADWECPVENQGDAPLILRELNLTSEWYDTAFHVVNTPLPRTILPQDTGFITIRFKPNAEATFYDTLIVYSNDSLQLESQITVQGTGTTSGTTGDLTFSVNNAYIDHPHRLLKKDLPLPGATVILYQNGQPIYGPVQTGSDGRIFLPNVAIGEYDFKITKQVSIPGNQPNTTLLDTLGLIKTFQLGPGGNSKSIVFPESLIVEKYHHIYNLTHIDKTSWDYTTTFHYDKSENQVRALLDLWKINLPVEVDVSSGRLILDEYMVYHLFDAGYSMGTEFVHDVGELINMVFYSDQYMPSIFKIIIDFIEEIITGDPLGALVQLVVSAVLNFMESHILDLIGEGIQQAAALLPNGGEQIVMAAWHDIASQYSGWGLLLGSFSAGSWSHMKGLIYNQFKNTLFQDVYIDILTDPQIEEGKNYSQNFQYNGEFSDAYDYTGDFIAGKLSDIETAESVCQGLRESAHLFNTTSSVLDLLGVFHVPGLGILNALNNAMKITAYVEVLSAIGYSSYEFFSLPEDMDNVVNRIYFPEGKILLSRASPPELPLGKMNSGLRSALEARLWKSLNDYDSTISEIKQQVNNGDVDQALIAMDDLMKSENSYQNNLKSSLAPIYTVAGVAQDSLASFPTMYDSIIASYAQAGEARYKNYLALLFFPSDSSQEMKDTVKAYLDRSVNFNHVLTDQVVATLDTVSVLPIPAIVVSKLTNQSSYELKPDEKATIKIQIENVGSMPAEGVSIILETNQALAVEQPDSIYVGSLSPGQTSDTISWTVGLFGTGYTRGTWLSEVNSSNAKTYSSSGAFVINQPQSPGTGGKLINENIYNYPNPFNPDNETTTLRYSLEKSGKVTIKIFDAGGNLVKTLLDNTQQSAGTEQAIPWDGKNGDGTIVANGVYFFTIESSQDERAVGKIAVLR
ncbi:MAG: FlgD immunoglobulin-like domain containing protein [Calditrichota bacterium]|jgi:hypothetical protein